MPRNPIIGKRFKRQGENFDLCERDFAKLASKSDEACHFVEVSPQRVGTGGNRAPSWWSAVLDNLSQPRSANSYSARDRERFDAEQATEWAALQERVENEAAPTSLDGFRRHANFVLKRFVRHDEVLRHVLAVAPPTKLGENSGDATQTSVEASPVEPVGFHRGEPYFLRKHLHKVFSERAWFRKFARVGFEAFILLFFSPSHMIGASTLTCALDGNDAGCSKIRRWKPSEVR